ncbi:MAG TPA: histidine kinase dimerization/phosphoacceptor domain -containing protein [Bacteroidia bacterium]|jgi:two-component sensor histidine kinase|nr:histidine kinase dimerization/phosphoacceptor domain -containing protein [Bacteroidia bacterium]
MLDESINLLDELDNASKIHILDRDDIDALMLEFARRIVATLKIERVNVWLFNPEKDSIISIGEYDLRSHHFSKNSMLHKKDFPSYFEAISKNRIILAPNIHTNSATREFTEAYSKPNDIISLMDVPLRMEGQLIGVICFEKTGKTERIFNEKEQTFALSISMVLASNLEARHRRAAQFKLESVIKEKELLIQEINHRVKNNFSILISLLRLSRQQGRTTDPKAILEEYEQRIFSMLKIQELLYQTKNYTSVNLSDYITELVNEFKRSHPEIAPLIQTAISSLNNQLPSKIAIHLGLIITEIFLNSVKHAHGKIKNYKMDISLAENSGSIKLKIGDNGKGFDFNYNLKKNSLGLHLIKSLSEDMDIKSQFPSEGNNFYEFTFSEEAKAQP